MTLPNTAQGGLRDLQRSMTGLVEGVMRTNLRAAQELFRLTNPGALVELQQRFVREYLDALTQGTANLVRASRRTADETLRPLEQQIEQRRQAANQGQYYNKGQHYSYAAEQPQGAPRGPALRWAAGAPTSGRIGRLRFACTWVGRQRR